MFPIFAIQAMLHLIILHMSFHICAIYLLGEFLGVGLLRLRDYTPTSTVGKLLFSHSLASLLDLQSLAIR